MYGSQILVLTEEDNIRQVVSVMRDTFDRRQRLHSGAMWKITWMKHRHAILTLAAGKIYIYACDEFGNHAVGRDCGFWRDHLKQTPPYYLDSCCW